MIILPEDIREALSNFSEKEINDFCIDAIREKLVNNYTKIKQKKSPKIDSIQLFTDGGSRGNPGPAAAGWIIKKDNQIVKEGNKFLGETTNNQAEYQALILGINDALKFSHKKLEIFMDSELAVKQLKGEYKVKNADLKPIVEKIRILLNPINWSIHHIPREKNKEADKLVNKAIDKKY